jgi:carbamoyltransferase
VLLMPLPLPQHLDQTCSAAAYQARFAELAEDLACTLHDPLPDLLRIVPAERRRLRWQADIHFTPAGHEALACSLAPVMARMLAQAQHPLPASLPSTNPAAMPAHI